MKPKLNHVSPAQHVVETEDEKEMGVALRAAQEDASAQQERNYAAKELAVQLGYEGGLTTDVIEGEIRFYQKRTVEAYIETGKRLLLLKELTKHGEFQQRIEALGFSLRSAQVFMSTAVKYSKSENFALLARSVKNMSVLMEIITQTDDVIDDLKEIKGVECLTASEMRKKIKELQAEKEATEKVLKSKNETIDKLQIIQAMSANEKAVEVRKKAVQINNQALAMLRGSVRNAVATIKQTEGETYESRVLTSALIAELQHELNQIREEHAIPDLSSDALQEIKNDAPQWWGKGIDGDEGESQS